MDGRPQVGSQATRASLQSQHLPPSSSRAHLSALWDNSSEARRGTCEVPVNPLDQKRAFSEYNLSDNEPVTVPAPGFRTVIPSKDWPGSQQTFRPS